MKKFRNNEFTLDLMAVINPYAFQNLSISIGNFFIILLSGKDYERI